MTRAELIETLSQKIHSTRRSHPLRVAIDGVDAAGKTTLADELGRYLVQFGRSVIRASIDGFHNSAAARRQRSDPAEGYYRDSFNYAALIHELLSPLGPGGCLRYRRAVFDYRADCPLDEPDKTAQSDSILLFDGVFLLRRELRQLWDFTILVEADFHVTLARAEVRDQYLFGDPAAVRNRYESRYIPGQRKYLDRERPELVASVIVRNNDPENPILEERIPIKEKGVARTPGHSISAAAIVRNRSGEVLLVRGPRRGWEMPGGIVEEGESPTEAAVREVKEESGFDVVVTRFCGIYFLKDRSICNMLFLADLVGGAALTSRESLEVGFFPVEKALEMVKWRDFRERIRDSLNLDGQPFLVEKNWADYPDVGAP